MNKYTKFEDSSGKRVKYNFNTISPYEREKLEDPTIFKVHYENGTRVSIQRIL